MSMKMEQRMSMQMDHRKSMERTVAQMKIFMKVIMMFLMGMMIYLFKMLMRV